MSKYGPKAAKVDLEDPQSAWAKVASYVPDGALVLDIGCSSGYLGAALIAAKSATVWGIELDPDDAALAANSGLARVLQGDIERFDWNLLDEQTFDVLIFADVLEHLKDPLSVLKQAISRLKPDGRVVASIPNIAHMSIRVELMEGGFVYEPLGILDDTHTKYFTRPTIVDMFHRAGVEVVRLDAVTNDLPEDLLVARLENLGLQADERFSSLLASPEARTYQYIVVAERASAPLEAVALPEKLVTSHWQLLQTLDVLRSQVAQLESETKRLEAEVEWRARRLRRIEASRSWRMARTVVRLVRRVGRVAGAP